MSISLSSTPTGGRGGARAVRSDEHGDFSTLTLSASTSAGRRESRAEGRRHGDALAAAAFALFLVRISSELKVLKVREQEAHCDAVADACGQRAASRENEFPG